MPDRWIEFCRRLAPPATRDRVFDPVVSDLRADRAEQLARAKHAPGRVTARVRFLVAALVAAFGCRRVAWREHAGFRRLGRQLGSDVRYTLRLLVRRPAFTSAALFTLALGVGANTAVFSYVNHLLLAGPPVPDTTGLVRVFGRTDSYPYDVVSFPTYRDLRDGVPGLDLAAHVQTSVRVGGATSRETGLVELVSGNFFRVLRIAPAVGRLIDGTDAAVEGSGAVVVLADACWRTRFGSDPGVVGRSVLLGPSSFEVIGIAPAGFRGTYGGEHVDFWVPLSTHSHLRPRGRSYEMRGWGWLQMIGRMDRSAAAVSVGLERVANDLHDKYEAKKPRRTGYMMASAHLLAESHRQSILPVLGSIFAFTALLLIVTCANLTGLIHTQLVARSREVAVRFSLGSSRGQIMRLWLLESLVIASVGGAIGLALARWTTVILAHVRPPAQIAPDLPIDIPFDWHVVGFTVVTSLVSALLFGWLPATRASQAQPLDVLKDVSGTSTGTPHRARLRRWVVTVQVAVAVVLLVASALLVRSLRNQQRFNPGFETERLGLVKMDLINQRVPAADVRALLDEALSRVRQVPGVTHAASALIVPLDFSTERRGLRIPGYEPEDPATKGKAISVDFNAVDSHYFETMGIPTVGGQPWSAQSTVSGHEREAVINQTMARQFWTGADPVGQLVELLDTGMFTVVGVVRDISYYQVGEPPRPYIYFHNDSGLNNQPTLHLRTSGAAAAPLAAAARLMSGLDPRIAPSTVTTFEELRSVPLFPGRALATTAAAFGIIALLLTAVGLYGVVSASVGQRRREIGVRMALGAEAASVLRSVLREALALAAAGAAFGFVGGYLVARVMKTWLFQIGPFDGAAYILVAAVVSGVALVAAWIPARRAAAIDPVVALR